MARANQRPAGPPLARAFADVEQAHRAIEALESAGVDPAAISVLTRSPSQAETLEEATGASEDLEEVTQHRNRLAEFVDWLGRVESVAVPGFGALLVTGDLRQDVAVGGSGRGAITGALVGIGLSVDEAAELERAVADGHILVVVHGAYDPAAARDVLARA